MPSAVEWREEGVGEKSCALTDQEKVGCVGHAPWLGHVDALSSTSYQLSVTYFQRGILSLMNVWVI